MQDCVPSTKQTDILHPGNPNSAEGTTEFCKFCDLLHSKWADLHHFILHNLFWLCWSWGGENSYARGPQSPSQTTGNIQLFFWLLRSTGIAYISESSIHLQGLESFCVYVFLKLRFSDSCSESPPAPALNYGMHMTLHGREYFPGDFWVQKRESPQLHKAIHVSKTNIGKQKWMKGRGRWTAWLGPREKSCAGWWFHLCSYGKFGVGHSHSRWNGPSQLHFIHQFALHVMCQQGVSFALASCNTRSDWNSICLWISKAGLV